MNTNNKTPKLLEKVMSLLPVIKQHAAISEQIGRLDDEILLALFEQRLFRLFISDRLNGESTDLPTALKVFENIASADGATGWLVMIGAGGGLFSGFFNEPIAQKIFQPEETVIAGSGAPTGTAKKTKGGYQVSGRWAYASGAFHANWFTANCIIESDDEQNGDIISIAVPAEQVQVHDTWSVFGMKATGSHDFSVEDVFVADEMTFSLSEPPLLDEPIYHYPLETLASLSFASVAIGIAQNAFDEFTEFSQHKTLAGGEQHLADDEDAQNRISQAKNLITSAREQLYQLAENTWETAVKNKTPDQELQHQIKEYAVTMVQNCVEASNLLYARAGMMPVFTSSVFGRAWRDLHTLSQHVIVAPK